MSGFGIIEEGDFLNQGSDLFGTVRGLDKMLDAIKWALARNLQYYPVVPGTKGLRVAEVGAPDTQAYVYYTEDGSCATLRWIEGA